MSTTDWLAAGALVVAVAALIVSVVSAIFTQGSTRAAQQAATAAQASERRARTPDLKVELDHFAPAPNDRVIYRVRNDGPQDLDSVVVYRPHTTDRITYPIAFTDGGTGWAKDEVDLGSLGLNHEGRFTLSCGAAQFLPEFRVRVVCRQGTDLWDLALLLPSPRGPGQVLS